MYNKRFGKLLGKLCLSFEKEKLFLNSGFAVAVESAFANGFYTWIGEGLLYFCKYFGAMQVYFPWMNSC